MNEPTYQELKTFAQEKRKYFINSKEYASKLLDIMLQILNLKDTPWEYEDLFPYKFNIEIISLYLDYLTLHESDFLYKNIDLLKYSLENSIYSSIEPKLLTYEINNLIDNKEESFLTLPLTIVQYHPDQTSSWIHHEVGAVIRKVKSYIDVEIIDKSGLNIPTRKNTADNISSPDSNIYTSKTIVNYHYQIPSENILELTKILSLGINHVQVQRGNVFLSSLQKQKKLNYSTTSYIKEYFFTKLSSLSNNEYYGNKVSPYQVLGNCFSKEIDNTLKIVLGEMQYSKYSYSSKPPSLTHKIRGILSEYKLPNTSSTKDIYLSLISILMGRLETLKFAKNEYIPVIIDIYNTYSYLKKCREDSPFKKELQVKLTDNFYAYSNLDISKLEYSNVSPNKCNINVDKIKKLRNELIQAYATPKILNELKIAIKNKPANEQIKWENSITCESR